MLENISTTDFLIISGAVVFLYILMYPQFQMRSARRRRIGSIRAMEEKWGTKVLTMIHRKEAISMFGVPVYQYIDIEDAEEILRGIREAKEKPIDLIIHTPGGHLHASIQIARALKNHTAKTRVFVPIIPCQAGHSSPLALMRLLWIRLPPSDLLTRKSVTCCAAYSPHLHGFMLRGKRGWKRMMLPL